MHAIILHIFSVPRQQHNLQNNAPGWVVWTSIPSRHCARHNGNYGGRGGGVVYPVSVLSLPEARGRLGTPSVIMAAGAGTAGPASGPGVVRDPMASQPRKRPSREGGEGARRSSTMAGGGGSSDSGGRVAGRRASRSGGRVRRGRHEPGLGGASERGAGEAQLEEAVNRWVLKFYFHEALRAFRSSRYEDFRQIRDIMQGEGRPGAAGRRRVCGCMPWGPRARGANRVFFPSVACQAFGEGAYGVPVAASYAVSVAH